MKREYQRIMAAIHVPPALNDRVLAAVHTKKEPVRRQTLWLRAAVCAVCAVAVLAGGVTLRQDGKVPAEEHMEYSLGLTAYAAGIGANGGVLIQEVEGQDMTALDGTVQTLSLTFADGQEQTGTYHLRAEKLRAFTNEDGGEVLVPALTGDTAETVSGLYAVPEDSIWFQWPVEGSNTVSLSAPYGRKRLVLTSDPPREIGTSFHSGIDIPAPQGTPVAAAKAGTVVEAGYDSARGNYLILDHGDGLTTLYGQCRAVLAQEGDCVATGDIVAEVGATGMATGPHLHFEVRQDGEAQNPVAYFGRDIRDTLKMG